MRDKAIKPVRTKNNSNWHAGDPKVAKDMLIILTYCKYFVKVCSAGLENAVCLNEKVNKESKRLMPFLAAGEPTSGVYPSFDGREPSFPNPTANLVSTRRDHIFTCFTGT